MSGTRDATGLLPYVARLHAEWHAEGTGEQHRSVPGTLVFADISGFTALTERLARKGKVGAEEMSDTLNAVFSQILEPAHEDGADLVKWGGDAVLLLFTGDQHAARACRASYAMRARLRTVGSRAGTTRLRMSVGVHTGEFDCYLVGDPAYHLELLVSGPAASVCARLEAVADAGDIAISGATVHDIGRAYAGRAVEGGVLLKGHPDPAPVPQVGRQRSHLDLQPLLPREIRNHLQLGETDPEHRDIAVAFVKFSGTDDLSRTEGPQAVATALDEVIVNVSRASGDLGVTFFETDIDADGGKIMLAAGVPTSAGHDGERLLRACRRILDDAGRLPLKIGANHGHVFSGDFGPRWRRTYSIKGDPINLAARVMGKAAPGQLLATETLMQHSPTEFEATPLAPFQVKGKALPVKAVDVGAILARRTTSAELGPLVGRVAEVAVLRQAAAALRAGRGGAVELVGEPGIGKSRLVAEAVNAARPTAVRTLHCSEYESSTPYFPFQQLLSDLTGVPVRADRQARVEALTDAVHEHTPHLDAWLPVLGDLMDLPVAETEATAGLDEQFRRRKVQEVGLELMHTLLPRPCLLVVEDAHHMDGASCELLDGVVQRSGDDAWLVLLTRRDVDDGWHPGEEVEIESLRPEPLTAKESVALVQLSTGEHPLPESVAALLAERAGGNPLFLESLVQVAGPTGQVEDLPESVAEVVTTQIDGLPPQERSVLRHASVLGVRFDIDYLGGLFDRPPDGETLDSLSEFLVPDGPHTMKFKHELIRDVAYEGLSYKRREHLHARIAELLEQGFGPDADSPELLALHTFHARDFGKAWHYSRWAGEQAKAKYAHTEAVGLLSRAVEAERRGPRGLVPPHDLAGVLRDLGDAWFTIGLTGPAAQAFSRARRLVVGDAVAVATLIGKQASIEQRLRKFPQSLRRLSRGLTSLEGLVGTEASAARCRLCLGYAQTRLGQGRVESAIEWAGRAAEEASLAGDRAVIAQAYATLHGVHVAIGRPSPLPYGEMALHEYTELADLLGQAHCTNNLAVEALDAAQWVEAEQMFGRAADIFRRLGDTASEANALCNQAEVQVDQGRLVEAQPLLDQVLTAARSVSDDELVAPRSAPAGPLPVSCRRGSGWARTPRRGQGGVHPDRRARGARRRRGGGGGGDAAGREPSGRTAAHRATACGRGRRSQAGPALGAWLRVARLGPAARRCRRVRARDRGGGGRGQPVRARDEPARARAQRWRRRSRA